MNHVKRSVLISTETNYECVGGGIIGNGPSQTYIESCMERLDESDIFFTAK